MKIRSVLAGLALSITGAGSALSAVVDVSANSGPWIIADNPTLNYGVGDNIGPTILSLASGATSVTITYSSGLTSEFLGAPPTVDALGYTYLSFGSGLGFSGFGTSGDPFPSYFIDPTNTGAPIYLGALIGAFTTSAGVVVGTPFATGDGPFTISIPGGATELSLGINDDIFFDNSGTLVLNVTGVGATPLPASWTMMLAGLAGFGFVAAYRRRKNAPAAIAAA